MTYKLVGNERSKKPVKNLCIIRADPGLLYLTIARRMHVQLER